MVLLCIFFPTDTVHSLTKKKKTKKKQLYSTTMVNPGNEKLKGGWRSLKKKNIEMNNIISIYGFYAVLQG